MEEKGGMMGEYGKRLKEVESLANQKAKGSANQEQSDKVTQRAAKAREGIEKLATQLGQINGWLSKNVDSIDVSAYKQKEKWITGNVDAAFYAVDRALHEWRPKRDRVGVELEGGSSVEVSEGTRLGGRRRGNIREGRK